MVEMHTELKNEISLISKRLDNRNIETVDHDVPKEKLLCFHNHVTLLIMLT